jgi:hypothetical protein
MILQLKEDCNDLSEEALSKLSVNLLNCQSQMEGRKVFPCTTEMVFTTNPLSCKYYYHLKKFLVFKYLYAQTLRECTQGMDDIQWNSYLVISNRARSVCYAARQQQFRALTQMTV